MTSGRRFGGNAADLSTKLETAGEVGFPVRENRRDIIDICWRLENHD
jgi:hypothetical protein